MLMEGLVHGSVHQSHSHSCEAWFVHIPGLVVVTPPTPADGKRL